MPRKLLPDGTWVHQTWEEVEAEASPEMLQALRTPIPVIDPEKMTEGERTLYERMQAEGEASAALFAAGLTLDDLVVEGEEVEDGDSDLG